MLQLFAVNMNVSQISKLLVKYKIKATVKDSIITIYGKVPEDLARQLYSTQIVAFNNHESEQCYIPIEARTVLGNGIKSDISPKIKPDVTSSVLRYPKVKRGEIYLCDLGESFEHEQAGKRYCIIIQNDVANKNSPNVIVIPCTTQHKTKLPVHHMFRCSSENMVNYSEAKVSNMVNIALGESITTVSKSRLIEYLGTMTEDFMDEKIQPIIERSLSLKRKTKTVTISKPEVKTVIQREIVHVEKNLDAIQMARATYRDLNLGQIQLLSFVDINELIAISKSSDEDSEKAHKILEIFGFDFSKNSVQLLLDAICISPKSEYFNMETLSKKVAEVGKYTMEASEIQRVIVARVKERFKLKKSPAIDFIRLVNSLLTKKEEKQDENSI